MNQFLKFLIFPLLITANLLNCSYSFTELSDADSQYTLLKINSPSRHNTYDWSTFKTIATGATIGASTGLLAQATDWFCLPFVWYITFTLRNTIIQSIIDKANANGEIIDGRLLSNSAWASDWLAYLAVGRMNMEDKYVSHKKPTVEVQHTHTHYMVKSKR